MCCTPGDAEVEDLQEEEGHEVRGVLPVQAVQQQQRHQQRAQRDEYRQAHSLCNYERHVTLHLTSRVFQMFYITTGNDISATMF